MSTNPETYYINHKISPSREVVSWLAAPQSESEIKKERGIGRLAAMDWNPYPLSTMPEEVEERKDRADNRGDGEKAKDTLDKFIEYIQGPEPVVIGARYQAATPLRGGMVVGSIGSLPEKEYRPPNSGDIVIVLTWDGKVVDAIPIEPGKEQEYVSSKLKSETSELGREIVETILEQGRDLEEDEKEEIKIKLRGERVYALQAIEFNRDADWVWNRHFPLFSDIQHRGTTRGWNKGSDHLRAAYVTCFPDAVEIDNLQDLQREVQQDGVSLPTGIEWTKSGLRLEHGGIGSVSLLSSGQLETLCNEFLRSGAPDLEENTPRYRKVNNVYPVGGKLSDVDIVAVGTPKNSSSERVEIVAQVSFEADDGVESKIRRIANWVESNSSGSEAFYFGTRDAKEDYGDLAESLEVTFLSIQDIFSAFKRSDIDTLRKGVLNEITQIPPASETACPEYPIEEQI